MMPPPIASSPDKKPAQLPEMRTPCVVLRGVARPRASRQAAGGTQGRGVG